MPPTGTILLAVAFLWTEGCSQKPSPDLLYRKARTLLHEGQLGQARATMEAGLQAEPSWRFRLLQIDVLLQSDPRNAFAELANTGDPESPEIRARLEMDRGWANYRLSDYVAAKTHLDRAGKIASALSLPLLKAEIDLDRGTVLAQQSDFPAAEENLRSALAAADRGSDAYLRVRAIGSLGWFLLLSHRPDEAIYWLEKQRDAATAVGAELQLASALGNLGSAYYRLGDYDRALSLLKEAEQKFAHIGDLQQQQAWLGNIGNVLFDTGQFDDAAATYARALEIARKSGDSYWVAWWEYDLASAYTHSGDFEHAERYNNEALRLKESIASPDFYPLINQAEIAVGRKDFSGAEKLYEDILAGPSDDPKPLLDAESGLSQVFVKTGQLDRADAQFRSGIEMVERRNARLARDEYKLSYLSSLIEFYQRYVDFLVDRGQADRAAEVAESSRARLLDERLNSMHRSAQPAAVASFRNVARFSQAIVLSYWLAPTRSFLWIITPEAVALYVLPPEKQIAHLVESYRTFIENLRDPLQSEFADARKLSDILLGPVRPLLHDGARLIIVPDGALNSLNFETLPDPADPTRLLIDRATVSVAPSLTLLTTARGNSPKSAGLLLIGDPEPAVEEYPRLPYAGREMKMIAINFTADRCTRLDGAEAYPAAYRASSPERFSWIHFAAHAAANRENPLDSALILSRHDGAYTLSAREVMQIPLNADLVTLSACRGAGAKTYSGEGLVGLSWAFLRAGAKNVVAGLWDVTDTSTASLMADFYSEMTRGSSPAEALRAAKLRLVHSTGAYRKPFYWGPFQLYAGGRQ